MVKRAQNHTLRFIFCLLQQYSFFSLAFPVSCLAGEILLTATTLSKQKKQPPVSAWVFIVSNVGLLRPHPICFSPIRFQQHIGNKRPRKCIGPRIGPQRKSLPRKTLGRRDFIGVPGGNRTPDQRIRSPLLYPLSYWDTGLPFLTKKWSG